MKSNEYECELFLLSKEVNSFIIKDMNSGLFDETRHQKK